MAVMANTDLKKMLTLDAAPKDVSNASGLTATANVNNYKNDLAWTDNASNELGYLVERSSDGGTT
jgi:hypothetical protein